MEHRAEAAAPRRDGMRSFSGDQMRPSRVARRRHVPCFSESAGNASESRPSGVGRAQSIELSADTRAVDAQLACGPNDGDCGGSVQVRKEHHPERILGLPRNY